VYKSKVSLQKLPVSAVVDDPTQMQWKAAHWRYLYEKAEDEEMEGERYFLQKRKLFWEKVYILQKYWRSLFHIQYELRLILS